MPDDITPDLELLADLVGKEDCVLFLGNDLPLGFPMAAPPCRAELAVALARELGRPASETDLATAALLFEGARGRNALARPLEVRVLRAGGRVHRGER